MISSILDHKNVALANIGWALLHVWIALEIEESMGLMAIVLVIGGIFALSQIRGQERSEDYATAITALPAGTPSRHWVRHRGDGVQWLCLADPLGPIIWVLIIPVTLLASTQEWTGIGASEE